MKDILILGDPHFGVRNNSKYFCKKQLEFYNTIMFPYIEINNIKKLIILGDTFDNRKNIDINILHTFNEFFFKRLESLNVEVIMIIGNHDLYTKNLLEINSVKHLERQFSNIKVIDEYEELIIEERKFAFASWIVPDKLNTFLENINSSTAEVLIGHLEINNFEMVKGTTCEHGLSESLFKKFQKVISGHFHVRSTKGNITYPSTQLEHNWSDYDLEKGFALLDPATLEISYVNNPVKIYHKITFSKEISVTEFDYSVFEDGIVRVYALTDDIKSKKFDSFIEKLAVSVHSYEIIPINEIALHSENVMLEFTGTKEMINLFIDSLEECEIKEQVKSKLFDLHSLAIEKINSDIL